MKSLRFWYENKYYSAVRLSVRESKHSCMLNIFIRLISFSGRLIYNLHFYFYNKDIL